MPKRYEAIRDRLIQQGMLASQAKERAAKIYNATRKRGEPPVTGKKEGKKMRGLSQIVRSNEEAVRIMLSRSATKKIILPPSQHGVIVPQPEKRDEKRDE